VSGIELPRVSTARLRGGDDFCGCGHSFLYLVGLQAVNP
jgi:hypothetical protein